MDKNVFFIGRAKDVYENYEDFLEDMVINMAKVLSVDNNFSGVDGLKSVIDIFTVLTIEKNWKKI